MRLDGSTSRTLLLLVVVASVSLLAWQHVIAGPAYVTLISAVVGGILHASGAHQAKKT